MARNEKRKIGVADCETDPFKFGADIKPFLWGYYDLEHGYKYFDKTEDFVDFTRDENKVIYVHNGGKFDFHFLMPYFDKFKDVLMINNRLVKCQIGKAEFRDSYAILPVPLSAYMKTKIDYSIFEKKKRNKPENRKLIIDYLKDDCVFLYELVSKFEDEYGRHLTQASAAIKKLQKMENLKIENSGNFFYETFKQFYFGGRVEALRPAVHSGDINYFDINSAYPFAMCHDHPIGVEYITSTNSNPVIKPNGFYKILARSYGAFCRREKTGLKFDWDGELREYFTTGHEIIAALETKSAKIEKHILQHTFVQSASFKNYIDYFYALRKTTVKNSPENIFAKIFMNGAYGKFAASPLSYKKYKFIGPEHLDAVRSVSDYEIAGDFDDTILISRPLQDDEMRFYNVATGASITGFVRAMILRSLKSVDKPIYCDTDSIIFKGGHNLKLGDEIGQWKIEGEFVEACIAGKKLYGLMDKEGKTKVACKGGALSYKQIKLLLKGHTIKYNAENPVFSWHKKPSYRTIHFKKTA